MSKLNKTKVGLVLVSSLLAVGCANPTAVDETARLSSVQASSLQINAREQQKAFNATRDNLEQSAEGIYSAQTPRRELVSRIVKDWEDKSVAFGSQSSSQKKLELFNRYKADDQALNQDPFDVLTTETPKVDFGNASKPDLSGLTTVTKNLDKLQGDQRFSFGDLFGFAQAVNGELADLENDREDLETDAAAGEGEQAGADN